MLPFQVPPLRSENTHARLEALRTLELLVAGWTEKMQRQQGRALDPIRAHEHRHDMLERAASAAGIGFWECDLPFETLTWTSGVYDIFELPHGFRVTREEALGFYSDESRERLEEVRSRAIRDCTGFTLDAEIMTALGNTRWMRITGNVEYRNDAPARLFGIKQDITAKKTR